MRLAATFLYFIALVVIGCVNNPQESDNQANTSQNPVSSNENYSDNEYYTDALLDSLSRDVEKTADSAAQAISKAAEEMKLGIQSDNKALQSSITNSTKYIFVVLEVSEDNGLEIKNYYVTSDILEMSEFELDENNKYKLLDDYVKSYKRSPSGSVYKGKIKSRKIYNYETYEKASKAREKFIMD
ncbi:hypothetical protein [Niabella aquatica]